MKINFSKSDLIDYLLLLTFVATLYYSFVFYETAHIAWLILSLISYIVLVRDHVFYERQITTTKPPDIIIVLTLLLSELLIASAIIGFIDSKNNIDPHIFRTLFFTGIVLLIMSYNDSFNMIAILKNNVNYFLGGVLWSTIFVVIYMSGMILANLQIQILPNSQVELNHMTFIRYGAGLLCSTIAIWMIIGSIIHGSQYVDIKMFGNKKIN